MSDRHTQTKMVVAAVLVAALAGCEWFREAERRSRVQDLRHACVWAGGRWSERAALGEFRCTSPDAEVAHE